MSSVPNCRSPGLKEEKYRQKKAPGIFWRIGEIKIAIVFLSTLFAVRTAFVQEYRSIGPEGGLVEMITTAPSDSNVLYAAMRSGSLFRSIDAGNTWTLAGWVRGTLLAIAVDPFNADIIYAGISPDIPGAYALLKSIDGGRTWSNTGWGSSSVHRIVIDPQNSDRIYIASSGANGGTYKSEDGGHSWTNLNITKNYIAWAIAVDPKDPARIYAALNNERFYRSRDYGQTWELSVAVAGNPQWMSIDPKNTNIIYLATSEGVFKSIDNGEHWQAKNSLPVNPQAPWTSWVLAYGNRVFRSNNDEWRLLVSDDGGDHWQIAGIAGGSLCIAGNRRLFSGTRDGIYSCDFSGKFPLNNSAGLNGTDIIGLAADQKDASIVYAVTCDDGIARANFYSWQDSSSTWRKQFLSRGIRGFAKSPYSSQILIAGSDFFDTGPRISFDGGKSWQKSGPDESIYSVTFSTENRNTIFAGGKNNLYKSVNLGKTWEKLGNLPGCHSINQIALALGDNVIFLAEEKGIDWGRRKVIVKSFDGGFTWTANEIPAGYLFIMPGNPGIVFAATQGSGFYKSFNSGQTWEKIFLDEGNISVNVITDISGASIIIGTSNGLFLSNDLGDHWVRIFNENFPQHILTLSYSESPQPTLFAGTKSGGVYRLDTSQLVNTEKMSDSPGFVLYQNFPNPFHRNTSIQFRIKQAGFFQLTIYNILGQKVRKLANDYYWPGEFTMKWDGKNDCGDIVPNGVYLYQGFMGGKSFSKKMLVFHYK